MGHGSDLRFPGGMGRPRYQRMKPKMLSGRRTISSGFSISLARPRLLATAHTIISSLWNKLPVNSSPCKVLLRISIVAFAGQPPEIYLSSRFFQDRHFVTLN